MYKRIIAAIIVKDGIAVQSFGYRNYQPLGDPITLAQNYARWGADEIVLLDISSTRASTQPKLDLISCISEVTAGTPLIYGGGIQDIEQVGSVISAGADRLILDDCLLSNPNNIEKISKFIGRQALIAAIPIKVNGKFPGWYSYKKDQFVSSSQQISFFENDVHNFSELLIIDVDGEGKPGAFNDTYIQFYRHNLKMIIFGGLPLTSEINELVGNPRVSAICFGNPLCYQEHTISRLRSKINPELIRSYKLL